MENKELYDDTNDRPSFTERYLGLSFFKFLLLILIVLAIGVYIGVLLYGTNSVEVLFGLQEYENYLRDEILRLKAENSELQRAYFELKEISAQ